MSVLGGRADALDVSSKKVHDTPLGAIQGEAEGLTRCCGPAALRIICEGIGRGVAGIGDVPASEVSKG
jgi:hypothetical protein